MFAEIHHIDDVLPHISYENGIVVARRDGYTVIDYAFVTDETFSNPFALECRGLKFAPDGRILARPFHKFFNIGEKQRPEDVDWSRPHVVMDKLDGSMVHPCVVGDQMLFMTRMGATDQARLAQHHASPGVLALCQMALAAGQTPIFEFTSPMNRVVVTYDTPCLTLLAVRETVSGRYLPLDQVQALGVEHGVTVAQGHGTVGEITQFIAAGRALEGVEGYVVTFADGHRLKLKADAYVLRHKALAGVAYEKNLLAWIAEDALDDVLPILHDDVADRVRRYDANLRAVMRAHLAEITALVDAMAGADRKDLALAVQSKVDKRLQRVAFALADGRDGMEDMMKIIRHASHSEPRVEAVRDLFALNWEGTDLILKDA